MKDACVKIKDNIIDDNISYYRASECMHISYGDDNTECNIESFLGYDASICTLGSPEDVCDIITSMLYEPDMDYEVIDVFKDTFYSKPIDETEIKKSINQELDFLSNKLLEMRMSIINLKEKTNIL